MASFYSSFFSSGLLAPGDEAALTDRSQSTTPTPAHHAHDPTTPRPALSTLEEATEPMLIASSSSNNVLPAVSSSPASDRPRLRRRRSSIGVAASPVAAIKSNTQCARNSATIQLQRQSLGHAPPGVSSRTRSGSLSESGLVSRVAVLTVSASVNTAVPDVTTKGAGIVGRLRSGSVGAALRPRRPRKHTIPTSAPALPPPSLPLPALPPMPTMLTRSASRRMHTTDGSMRLPMPMSVPIPIPSMKSATRSYSLDHTSAASMGAEDADFPSPLVTPDAGARDEYFGSGVVMAL